MKKMLLLSKAITLTQMNRTWKAVLCFVLLPILSMANPSQVGPSFCDPIGSDPFEPMAAAECTPPSTFDIDVVVQGDMKWSQLISQSPDDITTSIRILGTGKLTVRNSDLLLKSRNAVLYVDGPELVINNGNFQLDETGARAIFKNATLRTSGNLQQTGKTFLCIENSTVEVGDEMANGRFNKTGNKYTSANFQNDGGYRYLKYVCLNVTQDYQLESSGNGTANRGGLDVLINVCAEIGDAGANHANDTDFGKKDGDDSGNFQNNNTMQILNSEFVIANGNIQNESDSEMEVCEVDFRTNDGSFQNSGRISGTGLTLGIDDQIQNDGSWTALIDKWYAKNGFTGGISTPKPAKSSKATILTCFGDCNCIAVQDFDLELVKTVYNPAPEENDTVTFTLLLTNNGPGTADQIEVTDYLPSGYLYVDGSIAGGDVQLPVSPTLLVWGVNSLSGGTSVSLTFDAIVNGFGDYKNVAEVTDYIGTDIDSSPANDDGDQSEDDETSVSITCPPTVSCRQANPIDQDKDTQDFKAISVSPNPTADVLSINFYGQKEEEAQWIITDVLGRLVASGKETIGVGLHIVQLDVEALPAGNYYLQFKTNNWATAPAHFIRKP